LEALESQIMANEKINLIFLDIADVVRVDRRFLADIRVLKERHEELPEELLEHVVDRVRELVYRINQYLQIPPSGFEELKEIYRESWTLMDRQESSSVIVDHHSRLSTWLKGFYPSHIPRVLENNRQIGSVVNE
jgi:flagellar biosynthesis regulator FlbT